jgi:hypothetical protein
MSLKIAGGDYAWGVVPYDALRGHGWRFAMRYLSHDPTKDIDPVELRELHRRGIRVGLVFETTGGRALAGYDAGRADAIAADRHATAVGLDGAVIFFAVDQDVSAAAVMPYFRGVRSVLGRKRSGAYGSHRVVLGLFGAGLLLWTWQTYAWSGGLVFQGTTVYQFHNGVNIAGLSVDLDKASTLAATDHPAPTPAQRRRQRLVRALALLRQSARYHTGPRIRAAIRWLQKETANA